MITKRKLMEILAPLDDNTEVDLILENQLDGVDIIKSDINCECDTQFDISAYDIKNYGTPSENLSLYLKMIDL